MGGKTMMEKRGHHSCKMVNYDVRQKITQPTSSRWQGKVTSTPGSLEVMIYKGKKKIEGDMKGIKKAAQKIYDLLKHDNRTEYVSKKLIRKYNLV